MNTMHVNASSWRQLRGLGGGSLACLVLLHVATI
jgi:hypothetical protein